jgi:hypothetical protein
MNAGLITVMGGLIASMKFQSFAHICGKDSSG